MGWRTFPMSDKFVPKFPARQESGNLIVLDSYRFKKYIETLGDKELDITVKVHRGHCTDSQRQYYWPVIIGMIAEKTGHSEDEIHEILKKKFLTKSIELSPGIIVEIVGSTEDLDTKQREEYHKNCREWAWDFLRLSVPLPNEVDVNS